MISHKNKYILYLAILNGMLTVLLILYWKVIFEDVRSMVGITFALVLFFLYELFVILFTETKGETVSPRQSVNLFLGFKAGKIILSLLFLAVYAIIVKVEIKRFIGIFLVLYLIYLLFDTVYLASREKSLKTKQYKNKEIEKLSNYYKK
ncbi:MAG: hypothetical protein FWF53_01670 [Candidatus Azobacteroides sp.]|nr:hypothetical protein [Candidatus Azobacteroides sp.]